MNAYYEFTSDYKRILYLAVSGTAISDVYFQLYENFNGEYELHWRFGLNHKDFCDMLIKESCELLSSELPHSLNELVKTSRYRSVLEKYSPILKTILSENQKHAVQSFLENSLFENVQTVYGRDGHSYHLELFYPRFHKYDFWCVLPKEYEDIASVINMLIKDSCCLDYNIYGVRVR